MEQFTQLDDLRAQMAEALSGPGSDYKTPRLATDKWVMASDLQKAIRRGHLDLARSMAVNLLEVDRQMLWRRLQVTAFEDIGMVDLLVAAQVVAATDGNWRRHVGGDRKVILYLVERMCRAPKDRSTDLLMVLVDCSLDYEPDRQRLAGADLSALIDIVTDATASLPMRGIAAWYAAGAPRFPPTRLAHRKGDLGALFTGYQRLQVPGAFLEVSRVAARRLREPLPVYAPLVWSVFRKSKERSIEPFGLAPKPIVHSVPVYALDEHTRLGRKALRLFLAANKEVQTYLETHMPTGSRLEAINIAHFYVEGVEVDRQMTWDLSEELKTRGAEADVGRSGLDRAAIPGLLKVIQDNLEHLDRIRLGLLEEMASAGQNELFNTPTSGTGSRGGL